MRQLRPVRPEVERSESLEGSVHKSGGFAPPCFETPCGPCRLRQGYDAQAPRIEEQLWCTGTPRILRCERSEPRRTRTERANYLLYQITIIELALNKLICRHAQFNFWRQLSFIPDICAKLLQLLRHSFIPTSKVMYARHTGNAMCN